MATQPQVARLRAQLAAARARCAGLEATVRDLRAELERASDPSTWADARARHPPRWDEVSGIRIDPPRD